MRPHSTVLLLGVILAAAGTAQAAGRPVVGELFTSQGCSSCPPADAKLAALTRDRPDLLLLTFHVTYWNNLGWRDPFSLTEATERQRRYVALRVSPEVYTPALVIDGREDVIGADDAAVDASLRRAGPAAETAASVALAWDGHMLDIRVGAGPGHGSVLLIGYDPTHETRVARGENAGRTLHEANVVRSVSTLGTWSGKAQAFRATPPAGEAFAVLLQADDGRILGATRLSAVE